MLEWQDAYYQYLPAMIVGFALDWKQQTEFRFEYLNIYKSN